MKRITIFDNYETYKYFDEEKAALQETNPDITITDQMVWNSLSDMEDEDYSNAKWELKELFGENKVIALGTCGTWRGDFESAKIFNDFEMALAACAKECDYIKIEREGRHIYVTASHHDGTNHFELKVVTEKGERYYDNWNYGNSDKTEYQVLKTIWKSSNYSKLGSDK